MKDKLQELVTLIVMNMMYIFYRFSGPLYNELEFKLCCSIV